MRSLALALMFTTLALTATKADESCKAQARESKFAGDEEKATFTANCIKDAVGTR
jgi:hypothetical protein